MDLAACAHGSVLGEAGNDGDGDGHADSDVVAMVWTVAMRLLMAPLVRSVVVMMVVE